MGRYYALADHEPNEVAQALEEQYYPKQSGSPTPESQTGQILAIADKTDTLVGIFSAGLIPTGDKDPYALRRAALGIIRIIIEKRLNINITELIRFSLSQFTHNFNRELTEQKITTFIYERLKGYTLDHGFTFDQFESVLTVAPENLLDFFLRLQAVRDFRELPESNSLSEANKRIKNILRKSETLPHSTVENLVAEQELNLLTATLAAEKDIQPLIKDSNYTAALNRLTQLKEDVDLFFEHIMVNCDDRSLRTNRLALLYKVENLFLKIADISKLQ
jgi:glycyl-tRNA synthetase beta chain